VCYSIYMKTLRARILATVMLAIIALVIYWGGARCYSDEQKCIAGLTKSSLTNQAISPNEATAYCEETQSYLCRVLSAANFPTLLLVIVGFVGIFAAWRTLSAVEGQSSAQIKSERAWIIADIEPSQITIRDVETQIDGVTKTTRSCCTTQDKPLR